MFRQLGKQSFEIPAQRVGGHFVFGENPLLDLLDRLAFGEQSPDLGADFVEAVVDPTMRIEQNHLPADLARKDVRARSESPVEESITSHGRPRRSNYSPSTLSKIARQTFGKSSSP